MELSDRKKRILTAVVEGYIATAEPVGSKALAEQIGCSSAGISWGAIANLSPTPSATAAAKAIANTAIIHLCFNSVTPVQKHFFGYIVAFREIEVKERMKVCGGLRNFFGENVHEQEKKGKPPRVCLAKYRLFRTFLLCSRKSLYKRGLS